MDETQVSRIGFKYRIGFSRIGYLNPIRLGPKAARGTRIAPLEGICILTTFALGYGSHPWYFSSPRRFAGTCDEFLGVVFVIDGRAWWMCRQVARDWMFILGSLSQGFTLQIDCHHSTSFDQRKSSHTEMSTFLRARFVFAVHGPGVRCTILLPASYLHGYSSLLLVEWTDVFGYSFIPVSPHLLLYVLFYIHCHRCGTSVKTSVYCNHFNVSRTPKALSEYLYLVSLWHSYVNGAYHIGCKLSEPIFRAPSIHIF